MTAVPWRVAALVASYAALAYLAVAVAAASAAVHRADARGDAVDPASAIAGALLWLPRLARSAVAYAVAAATRRRS